MIFRVKVFYWRLSNNQFLKNNSFVNKIQGGGFLNPERLTKAEYRALSRRFAKTGQLDDEMVNVINRNEFSIVEFKSFAYLARLKLLQLVWDGSLSKEQLNAVYQVVKVRNYYDVKTGRSSMVMITIIAVFVLFLTATSSEWWQDPLFYLLAVGAFALIIGLNYLTNRLMLGRLRREFEKAVAKGYPELKDSFEF